MSFHIINSNLNVAMLYSASLLHIPSSSHATSFVFMCIDTTDINPIRNEQNTFACVHFPHPLLFIEAEKPFMHFFQIRHCGSVSTESNWGLVAVFSEPTVTHRKKRKKSGG